MTSDQQDSDLNNTVQKTGTGLNPNADTFFYTKTLTPSSVDKGWEPGEEFLTNGDLKQDEVGGGFSSGDSLVSDSPPAPTVDAAALDTGAPPPEFIPDPMVGMSAAVPMVGAQASPSGLGEDGAMAAEQVVDIALSSVAPTSVIQAPLANGFGPGQPQLDIPEGGAQAPDLSSQPDNPADISKLLLAQLEYYFSRPNLMQDHYLQSQMDGDQYVPISTIANFNQVVKLTRDYDLIVEILRSSKIVQVDETGTKVRPKHNRSVLMLREIPDTTQKAEVEALFQSEKCPKLTSCEFAHNGYWYITFSTDDDAREAYLYLRANEIKFQGKPVLARIKAKPLVRAGGGAQFTPNKNPSRQQQQQQDAAVPYLRQQQAQYPVLTPMSQFTHQQQVPQAVSPFQLYNFQPMMPQWGTPSTAAPTFLDPGAMLAMNGYQATSIKPSTNHARNMYPVRNNNNRGMTKPHHRPQSVTSDKMPDSRPLDRPHTSTLSAARASPRNSNQHTPESHVPPPPFSRSRSEGAPGNGHLSGQLHSAVSAAPTPLVPEDSLPHHSPAQPTPSSKPDMISTVQPNRKHYSDSRRQGNYRRSRRNDEGAKNSRSNPIHGGKDGKPHEAQFELEATSFPPLPGSTNNSSSSDAPEGNKLSDVVKGTARPHTRFEEKVKAAPPAASSTVAAAPAAAPASAPTATPLPGADGVPAPPTTNTSAATPLTAAAVVSAVAASVAKETEVSASPSLLSHTVAPTASATAVEPSAHPSKTSKTSGHPACSSAAKPASEAPVTPKQATVSTAPAKQTTPTPAPTPTPAAEVAPAKLSYAQMVARKQQAENAARHHCEEGAQAAARPATQTTLREQSQTQASASVSASAPPKSASASARPPAKEPPRKDFEPKEQRFQGSRRAKENRDSRQPRFDRRRSDRDVKVPAK